MFLRNRYEFSAAHRLTRYDGLCHNLHGHNYTIEIGVDGPIDPESGMVIDFYALDKIVSDKVISILDHSDLNEVMDYPTAEYIAVWIWRRIKPVLDILSEVTVYEIPNAAVIYRGEDEPA